MRTAVQPLSLRLQNPTCCSTGCYTILQESSQCCTQHRQLARTSQRQPCDLRVGNLICAHAACVAHPILQVLASTSCQKQPGDLHVVASLNEEHEGCVGGRTLQVHVSISQPARVRAISRLDAWGSCQHQLLKVAVPPPQGHSEQRAWRLCSRRDSAAHRWHQLAKAALRSPRGLSQRRA